MLNYFFFHYKRGGLNSRGYIGGGYCNNSSSIARVYSPQMATNICIITGLYTNLYSVFDALPYRVLRISLTVDTFSVW